MKKPTTIPVTLRLNVALMDRVRADAEKKGQTITTWVNRGLAKSLPETDERAAPHADPA